MTYSTIGWFCGVALGIAIVIMLQLTSVVAGGLLGFSLGGLGMLLGKLVDRR